MRFNPIPFSAGGATILAALGYQCEHVPETWEDVGGPESGPLVVGHGAGDVWTKGDHVIVVEDGMILLAERQPPGPWGAEEFDDIPF